MKKHKRISVLVLKKSKKELRVCLVTGRSSNAWIPPTGKYERKLSNPKVAMLEAFEEAGVQGKIDKKVALKAHVKSPGGKKRRKVLLYRLWAKKVYKRWPEKKQRKRTWVKPEELFCLLKDQKLAKALIRNCPD